jgi:hypothetical protein
MLDGNISPRRLDILTGRVVMGETIGDSKEEGAIERRVPALLTV